MNLEYFNPKTSNPQDYFWFYNFKPDDEIKGDRKLFKALTRALKGADKGNWSDIYFDPIVSKILNAKVYYLTKDDLQITISTLNKMAGYTINRDIRELQINFNNGNTIIFIEGKDCLDIQIRYDHKYDVIHEQDPYTLFKEYIHPIHGALEKFLAESK
jgi:hypothetical protein